MFTCWFRRLEDALSVECRVGGSACGISRTCKLGNRGAIDARFPMAMNRTGSNFRRIQSETRALSWTFNGSTAECY